MRRRRRSWIAFAIAALTWAGARAAAAQSASGDGHVYLSWVRLAGAESCPGVRQIADDVSRRLGWNPFRESPTQFIEAQIRREPSGDRTPGRVAGDAWVAEIFLRDASGASRGNRVFTSNAPTCRSLASVVALSIAIIIDPDVMIRHFTEEDFWPPAAAPAPPPGRVSRTPGARGALLALGGAGLRLLPRPAPAVGLAGEVKLAERLALRLGGVVLPETPAEAPNQAIAFGLTAGWLGACFDLIQRSALAVGACAGAMGGVMHVVVTFPDATHPGERAFWALTGGLRLAVRLSDHLEVQVVTDGLFALDRRQFAVKALAAGTDPRAIFTQPAAAALVWAGLGVRFR